FECDATMPTLSVTDLQRQIDQRERELQALREELEVRRGHLTELTRRKEELQRQLQQIEEEITSLAATPPIPEPAATVKDQPRLDELVVAMLRESSEPRTARQLCEEAQRR